MSLEKIIRRLKGDVVRSLRSSCIYPWIYASSWHEKLFCGHGMALDQAYFSAIPNRGAGIGHQMANWIAGYWFAKQFGLRFAHVPFSSTKWETFLGFGEGEVSYDYLRTKGFKQVVLPLFDEYSPKELGRTRRIIESYAGERVIFVCEQDQGYRDQYGVCEVIQRKFHEAPARKNDNLQYSQDCYNIAIHVRRGDIVAGKDLGESNMVLRWQDAVYFEKVLEQVLASINPSMPIAIYLFSQGLRDEFKSFEKYDNLHWCLDMGPQESFSHMVHADLLITSKSSFSYKPALLSKGMKVCPRNFWHGYPHSDDWILVDDDGEIGAADLEILEKVR